MNVTDRVDLQDLGALLYDGIAQVAHRVRRLRTPGALSMPQRAALTRLREQPMSPAELARIDQVSPQSIGATLTALESLGLVRRSADPHDRRKVLVSISDDGAKLLAHKRDARTQQFAKALGEEFTEAELSHLAAVAPLLVRLSRRL